VNWKDRVKKSVCVAYVDPLPTGHMILVL